VPDNCYAMVICLVRVGRLLFHDGPVSVTDADAAEEEIVGFLKSFYEIFYDVQIARVQVTLPVLCRAEFSAQGAAVRPGGELLVIRSKAVYWHPYPMTGSRSRPHEGPFRAVGDRRRAEMLLENAGLTCSNSWRAVSGDEPHRPQGADRWSLS